MLNVSIRATMTAPIATPENDSSPPSTVITNDRSMKEPPKSGVNEYRFARSAPARPVKAIPRPNVSIAVRPVSIPASWPASRFCVRARTDRPNQVWCRNRWRPTRDSTAIPKTTRRMTGTTIPSNWNVAMVSAEKMERSSAPHTP
jgi:hypothetical protein